VPGYQRNHFTIDLIENNGVLTCKDTDPLDTTGRVLRAVSESVKLYSSLMACHFSRTCKPIGRQFRQSYRPISTPPTNAHLGLRIILRSLKYRFPGVFHAGSIATTFFQERKHNIIIIFVFSAEYLILLELSEISKQVK
jgi:hypothetical protein